MDPEAEADERANTGPARDEAFDAVVIGSGVGGLCAALTLARAGHSVAVLEGAKQLGGYLNPFARGSYRFDPAVHYVGECGDGQLFDRLLRELGLRGEVAFCELDPEGFDRLVFPGCEVRVPRGAERFHARLRERFPAERAGLERFFALLAEVRAMAPATLAPRAWAVRAPAPREVLRVARYHRATFGAVLADHFSDPLLCAVLAGQSGDYALPPSRASALVALGLIDHYLGGAYAIVGGSGALRDALVAALKVRGAVLARSSPVERVLVEDGRACGVRTRAGRTLRARAVVSNVDATRTYHELVDPSVLSRVARRRAAPQRASLSAVTVFVGARLDMRGADLGEANVWHHATTDLEAFYRDAARDELAEQDFGAFFLASPSMRDDGRATSGGGPTGVRAHTFQFCVLASDAPFARWAGTRTLRRGAEYDALKARIARRALAAMEAYVPGLTARAEVVEVATPLTHAAYVGAPRGGLYGPEQTPEQVATRPTVRGLLPGLYLCGASVAGGGVVTCGLSGHDAGLQASAFLRGETPTGD